MYKGRKITYAGSFLNDYLRFMAEDAGHRVIAAGNRIEVTALIG
jgi:hypothetical protein